MTETSFAQTFDARFRAALAPDRYLPFAPLHYGRIIGDVLQFIIAHCNSEPQAELTLETGTLLLCEPHSFLSFDIGGGFPNEQQASTYRAADRAQWQQVSELAVLDYLAVVRPRLEKRSSLSALMDHVFTLLGHSGSPHLWFTLAVGHARLADETRARALAQEALVRYRKCAEHEGPAMWPKKGEQRCELLVHELYADRTQRLLDGWKAGTLAALGLENLLPQ